MSAGAAPVDLVTVELLALPLRIHRQSSEHSDGLFRELALVLRSENDESSVPARLLRLIDELHASFGAFGTGPNAALADALARGDEEIDLVYQVPARVREAAIDLDVLLDEADAFCRQGEHLLTLATPPRLVAFRKWFLREFAAQVAGAAPTPWPEYAARSSDVAAT